MTWPKAVIRRLSEKIKTGTKFFIDHAETNSHKNRESVGEVLTSYIKEIGGKLSSIIIGHFPNADKVNKMDVCSVEAEVYSDEKNIVGDIDDVTGVALGNSEKDNPAFPGAVRLGSVQCFDIKPESGEDEMAELTFDDVVAGMKKFNVRPRQVFSEEDLKDDREFGKVYDSNATLTAENERLKKEAETNAKANQEAQKLTEQSSAQARLDEFTKEGFTPKQKEFINKRFDPTKMEDLTDEGIKTFLESTREDYSETAKLFGVSEEKAKKPNPDPKSSEDQADDDFVVEALKILEV